MRAFPVALMETCSKELINEKRLVLGGSGEDSELILIYEEKAFD